MQGIDLREGMGLVNAYLVNCDVLHTLQDSEHYWGPLSPVGMLMPDTVGRKFYIGGNGLLQGDARHGMGHALKGLEDRMAVILDRMSELWGLLK